MFTASEEAREVIGIFREAFKGIKETPKLLYGLGVNSKAVINSVKDYNIIGVMDAKHEGEYFEGLKVFSEQEAREASAIIIIIARDAVIPIIYNRISHLADAGIKICNVRGQELQVKQTGFEKIKAISEEAVQKAICVHDIICFDIFDTLLVRKVVAPNDIFTVVERRLRHKGIEISFCKLRTKAAAQASAKKKTPNFTDIYRELADLSEVASDNLQLIMEEEIRAEQDFIMPREKVVGLLEYAKQKGKTVFLVSEMYFESEILQRLLSHCGIQSYDKIFVSCEYGCNKWPNGDLFRLIKERYAEGKTILHIGDNEGADVLCAQKQGVDALKMIGVYEALEYSRFSFLLSHNRTIADSMAIGLFAVRYFSNPFEIEKQQTIGKVNLAGPEEAGYVAYGPLVVGFLAWLYGQCKQMRIDFVGFIARDGWVLSKVWDLMVNRLEGHCEIEGKYLLGSRRAVAVAALRSREDIVEALQKVPREMDNRYMMKSRFGITNFEQEDIADREKCVASWEEEILDNAEKERKRYKAYVNAEAGTSRKIAITDAVSAGTIAKYFQRATGFDTCLMCFVESRIPDYSVCDEINTYSYFGQDSKYAPKYEIHKHVVELESVLTAPCPMFVRFSDQGEEYAEEESSKKNRSILSRVHAGILQYADEFYHLIEDVEAIHLTSSLCDTFFGFVYSSNACFEENSLKGLRVRDLF